MNQVKPSASALPVLPIRDRVVFPHLEVSLVVGRDRSIHAIQKALSQDRLVFVTAQRHVKVEEPQRDDLFEYGTVAEVLQSAVLPEGIIRVRLVGRYRAKLIDLSVWNGCLMGDVQPIEIPSQLRGDRREMEALRRMVLRKFEEYAAKLGRIAPDIVASAMNAASLDVLADVISDALVISVDEKQDLIEMIEVPRRLTRLVELLNAEIEILEIERKIQNRVHKQIEKNQKEYYLNEQMRAIQKELKRKDDLGQEAEEFRRKIKALKMPAEQEETALKEVSRLEKMMPFSPEATVIRGYVEWIVSLPWSSRSEDHLDVKEARRILDEDHFGLEKPKERIIEYLAVMQLTQAIKGPILCFVGPPGTGKTSIAKSMARALGREFARISLGGVRDESDIRGHRRTYIGSMPGRIIQTLRKTKTKNPVILLDEIDKMGTDWRGDPAAALLEVLDPEQNKTFTDHFLDMEFDLSEIIFITTANSLYGIPPTLQDRMEVIRFSAYTTDEKAAIAKRFILPKELKEHGLEASAVSIEEEALRKIIHAYTQEAGVRELRRKIAKICRKVAVDWIEKAEPKKDGGLIRVSLKDISQYLGVAEFVRDAITVNSIGIATGLAYTDHGGEVLTIEVTTMPGRGKVYLTGKLGSVMQESAQAALSLVKSMNQEFHIKEHAFQKQDIHVHVPEGAVPKDGPSAGIALATAIVSALTHRPVQKNVAMTGEVTLRGRVLPIGGLKEKVLAAFREGISTVLYPKANEKDLHEIPVDVQKAVRLVPVESIHDVFKIALTAAASPPDMVSAKPVTQSQSV